MGHILIPSLPQSRRWLEVVDLLAAGGPAEDVAAAGAIAAEREFLRAADDAVFVETVRLLAEIPLAAGGPQFGQKLRALGLAAPDEPDLSDILLVVGSHLDRHARQTKPTDFGELARRALIGTLSSEVGAALPGLIEAHPSDVQGAFARLGNPRSFSFLARRFFTRLSADTLASWLDRTLSAHVGPDHRFAHVGDRAEFDGALAQHCAEAAGIVRDFSEGWYAKRALGRDRVDPQAVAGFAAVGFRKISAELRRRRKTDA